MNSWTNRYVENHASVFVQSSRLTQIQIKRFDNPDGLMQIGDGYKNNSFSWLTFDPLPSFFYSYIANLSPSYIFALSGTVFDHQVPALREAIWKHVTFQPSIGVKLPVSAYYFNIIFNYRNSARWFCLFSIFLDTWI